MERKIALFINENDKKMVQYSDFAPNYRFAVDKIENNTIKIIKLIFAKNDNRDKEPSIRIPIKLILDQNKKYIITK
jgi:hypothetical protein